MNIKYKTSLCGNWVNFGRCPYINCLFAHGHNELNISRNRNRNRGRGGSKKLNPDANVFFSDKAKDKVKNDYDIYWNEIHTLILKETLKLRIPIPPGF